MNLSKEEKNYYEKIFATLDKRGIMLDYSACLKVISRGIDEPKFQEKVWYLASGNGKLDVLTKKDFFKMLKLIAAFQQGYNLDEVSVESLPSISKPNLPKKSEKEKANNSTMSLKSSSINSQDEEKKFDNPPLEKQSSTEEKKVEEKPESEPQQEKPQAEEEEIKRSDEERAESQSEEKSLSKQNSSKNEESPSINKSNNSEAHNTSIERNPSFEKSNGESNQQNSLQKSEEKVKTQESIEEDLPSPFKSKNSDMNAGEINIKKIESTESDMVADYQENEIKKQESSSSQNYVEGTDLEKKSIDSEMSPNKVQENEKLKQSPPKFEGNENSGKKPKRNNKDDEDENPLGKIEKVDMPVIDEDVKMDDDMDISNPFKKRKDTAEEDEIIDKYSTLTNPQNNSVVNGKPQENGDDDVLVQKPLAREDSKDDCEIIVKPKKSLSESLELQQMSYKEWLQQRQKFTVKITDTKTNNSGIFGYGSYTSYIIHTQFVEDPKEYTTEVRFSDFEWLHTYLHSQGNYKGLVFPELPIKKSVGNTDPGFIQQRKYDLEKYLMQLSRHQNLGKDRILRAFLGDILSGDFKQIKEKNPLKTIDFANIDFKKLTDTYDYIMASFKAKLRSNPLPFEIKNVGEHVQPLIDLDDTVEKIMEAVKRKKTNFETLQTMSSNLNILETKIMNRISNQSYYAIASLCTLFSSAAGYQYHQKLKNDEFIDNLKIFKDKLDGFKRAYHLLLQVIQEIWTNRELLKDRQDKAFEIRADGRDLSYQEANRGMTSVEKKIHELEQEVVKIKENIYAELKNISEEATIYFPDILKEHFYQQSEAFEKTSQEWINLKKRAESSD